MTEDEKQETKEQLKSLHQAYSELSQQCADQTPTAEQVNYLCGLFIVILSKQEMQKTHPQLHDEELTDYFL